MKLAAALPFSPVDPDFSRIYGVNSKREIELLTQKNRLKGGFSKKVGPSDRIRTCGILLPNNPEKLFPVVSNGF